TPRTCAQATANCGQVSDGCGGVIDGGCGTCTAPQTCGGGGAGANHCGGAAACVPKSCAQLGRNCGPVGDGCGGLIDGGCGSCTAPQTCGGGDAGPNICGGNAACTPRTCAQLNFNCGQAGDGCGVLVDG